MTKRIWTGALTAIVGFATVAITAQTPATPQTSTSSAGEKVTVTGCLKEAPASSASATTAGATATAGTTATTGTAGTTGTTATTGTAGTAGDAAAAAQKFLLTEAAPAAAPAAADPAAPPSTAGATATGAAAQTYRLIANAASLVPHIGKKLELTGTIEAPGSATTTESAAGPEANAPALRVESGKVVAASCSQ
jgi:hypothetical protein